MKLEIEVSRCLAAVMAVRSRSDASIRLSH